MYYNVRATEQRVATAGGTITATAVGDADVTVTATGGTATLTLKKRRRSRHAARQQGPALSPPTT